MWMFTQSGFYSVVENGRDKTGDTVMVRARVRKDLVNLGKVAASVKVVFPAIIKTSDADYLYRVVVRKTAWKVIAAALASRIDYTNFKDRIHDQGDKERDMAYMAVWSAMNRLQGGDPERWRGRQAE